MTREEAITILNMVEAHGLADEAKKMAIEALEQEPNTGHCKDCRWWKDSDGMFRRGCNAESQCPMNRIEVYEGTGYCFMFEPQERSE